LGNTSESEGNHHREPKSEVCVLISLFF